MPQPRSHHHHHHHHHHTHRRHSSGSGGGSARTSPRFAQASSSSPSSPSLLPPPFPGSSDNDEGGTSSPSYTVTVRLVDVAGRAQHPGVAATAAKHTARLAALGTAVLFKVHVQDDVVMMIDDVNYD